jgi:hypothetical protein
VCEECVDIDVAPLADECVARGIAHLDEVGPDNWRDLINWDKLDLGDPLRCIVGQVFDSVSVRDSGYGHWWETYRRPQGLDDGLYGFNNLDHEDFPYIGFADMEAAWKRAFATS